MKIEGKNIKETPRVSSDKEVKEAAMDREECKRLHRQEQGFLIRSRVIIDIKTNFLISFRKLIYFQWI